ncbi:MAG TPA: hypothetical protein VER36_00510 [Flavisolibacter sp.]|nr:hypothetical protein [Flavisolibacter sp.]
MKKSVLLSIICFCFIVNADAQAKAAKKKSPAKKSVAKKTKAAAKDTVTVRLSNTTNSAAYAPSGTRYQIADPTINALNQRAAGAPVQRNTSPVLGMPKATYGIANGRILLRNTTAVASGTTFGSGAVATGTSIQGTGTSEATIGVNGKSPYAGPWLWGDRRPAYQAPVGDSSRRQ